MKRRMGRLADTAVLRLAALPAGSVGRALGVLTRASDGAGLWLAVAAGLVVTGRPEARTAAAKGTLALAVTSALVNGPVKTAVRRPRPGRWATLGRSRAGKAPRTSSFPSGHTASAFAFVTAAGPDVPALAPALAATAGLVGWSRVHSGQHFPTDVAAGAALGVAGGLALRWGWRRVGGRAAPPVARAEGGTGAQRSAAGPPGAADGQ